VISRATGWTTFTFGGGGAGAGRAPHDERTSTAARSVHLDMVKSPSGSQAPSRSAADPVHARARGDVASVTDDSVAVYRYLRRFTSRGSTLPAWVPVGVRDDRRGKKEPMPSDMPRGLGPNECQEVGVDLVPDAIVGGYATLPRRGRTTRCRDPLPSRRTDPVPSTEASTPVRHCDRPRRI